MSGLFTYGVGLLSGASLATAVIYDFGINVSQTHAVVLLAFTIVATAIFIYKNV